MIGNSWDNKLSEEYKKEYFTELMNFVKDEYDKKTIYPKKNEVFNAFRYTDFNNVKVVILGQRSISWSKSSRRLIILS